MNAENKENLKELFEKFVGAEQAERIADDIRKAEQILSEYPAPAPDDVLIADIKAQIAEALPHGQVNVFRRIAYKTAIVAAAVIVIAAISVRLFDKGPVEVTYASMIPDAIWESSDISADYVELAILNAEIEQIEGEAMALELGENGGNGQADVAEIEMELIAINSDFWKG